VNNKQPPSFSSDHSLKLAKKVGRPWAPLKNCFTKGEGFDLKSFGGKLVKGKKMLFQAFN
jgi:hypothetical protein